MNLASSVDSVFIGKLTEITLANLGDETFGVEQLVEKTGLSHFVIRHRVKLITKKTISQFIVEIRLQKALEMLRNESVTSSEVAYRVGFGSPNYFNKCFHEFYGYPPGDVKKRSEARFEDISPESVVPEQQTAAKNLIKSGWKKQWQRTLLLILTGIITAVILVYLFDFFILNSGDKKGKPPEGYEKSIAVLPFINDSQDSANVPFINGLMEGILDNLQKIKELKVLSRTSAEQYRNNKNKTIPQIAKELGVNYIVEGSGQKYGDELMLSVQLIEASSDRQLFSKRYTRKWEDIFDVQSEISTLVANSIKATITPEEAELIEKKPTDNIAALNLHMQGIELVKIATFGNNKDLEQQAEVFFKRAIRLDSTFANPYVHLGWRFSGRRNYDSALYCVNQALHFNENYADAYYLKGSILLDVGLIKEAEDAVNQYIKFNPNSSDAFILMGSLYFANGEFPNGIEYLLKALQMVKDPFGKSICLRELCRFLYSLGLYKEGLKFAEKLIEYHNDSVWYCKGKLGSEMTPGNYHYAINTALSLINRDREINSLSLADICLYLRDYRKALKYVEGYIELQAQKGDKINPSSLLGFIFLKNGQKEKSKYHFEGAVQNQLKRIELNQLNSTCRAYLNLVVIYSAMADKSKAMENLRKTVKCKDFVITPAVLLYCKNHPIFDTILDDPEYQEFIKMAENRFLPDREKIEKLLQEEGIFE